EVDAAPGGPGQGSEQEDEETAPHDGHPRSRQRILKPTSDLVRGPVMGGLGCGLAWRTGPLALSASSGGDHPWAPGPDDDPPRRPGRRATHGPGPRLAGLA